MWNEIKKKKLNKSHKCQRIKKEMSRDKHRNFFKFKFCEEKLRSALKLLIILDTQKCERNWKEKINKVIKIEFSVIEIFKTNKKIKIKFDKIKFTLNETLPRNQGLYFGLDSDDLESREHKKLSAQNHAN